MTRTRGRGKEAGSWRQKQKGRTRPNAKTAEKKSTIRTEEPPPRGQDRSQQDTEGETDERYFTHHFTPKVHGDVRPR